MSLKSIILGACIGAGVAILYAPASGSVTRGKIRDKAVGMGHDVSDYVEGKTKHLSNKMQGYKAKAQRATEKIQQMMGRETSQHEMAMSGDATA